MVSPTQLLARATAPAAAPARSALRRAWDGFFGTRGELVSSLAAGVLLAVGFTLERLGVAPLGPALVWASLGLGLLHGGRAAWESLREIRFDIDALMVVGAVLAAALGHPEEGALLLVLFVLSGALEAMAMERTRRDVEALHRLMPDEALALRDGVWTACRPDSLAAGDRIKIRPGELVPADARVESGASAINQASLTGESMPRAVGPGDEIYSGTLNTDVPLEAVVLRPASQSSLQKVLDLVTLAREQREPVQRLIDRLSQPYSTGVLLVSLAVLLVWRFGFGEAWGASAYTAITLLIVASPCALVIATPTATLAAIARAARSGVLFKGGQSIDRLARTRAVCFDKTGTLTVGRPVLDQVHPVAWSHGRELLSIAAGLEGESTHPIASAVREAAERRGLTPAPVVGVAHVPGRGVVGVIDNRAARLGSFAHAEPLIPMCLRGRVREVLEKVQGRGQIGVVVAVAGDDQAGEAAVLILRDAVRPGARRLVERLHAMGVRPVKMLTGDHRLTAQRVADALGLDAWDAELLPQDKVTAVERLKRDLRARHRPGLFSPGPGGVAVIGDGVNDAPALAAADVSVAIGSIGSDAALESADIVLLSDDLSAVPWALALARRTRRTVRLNLTLALSVILLVGSATLVGSRTGAGVPLSLGVLAHEGGTLLVVAHSLLLLAFPGLRSPTRATRARAADRRAQRALGPRAGVLALQDVVAPPPPAPSGPRRPAP